MNTIAQPQVRKTYIPLKAPAPVLHIIKSLGRGGAEVLLPEALRKHDRQRFAFHYLYFLPWKNQVVPDLEAAGGKVVCFAAKDNIRILMQARKIIAYVKANNIQLIHCHLPWGGIVGRLVGRITGIPVVYTEHNKWERYHRLTYYANKWSFGSQQKVLAVSGEVAKSIKMHYHKASPEVEIVLNGIDTEKFSSLYTSGRDIRKELDIPPGAPVIGVTCVFRAQKRLTIWLEIAARLKANHPDLHFIMVGDGVLREEVNAKAAALKTERYVHFAGLQTEVRPYMQAMDVFMMSSEFEGLPIALLEAMSMGCIPACTAAGGIPEVIRDKVNGLLVPVNDPLLLVEKLSALLQEPASMPLLKKAARETVVRHFSMERMVGQLEKVYHSLTVKK